jgi:hypothetical protein
MVEWYADPELFGDEDPDSGWLLAGLIQQACQNVTGFALEDVITMNAGTGDLDDTLLLRWLPEAYRAGYTGEFARKFLIAVIDLGTSMVSGFTHPGSVAEELALRFVLDQVSILDDVQGAGLPEHWRASVEDALFEDMDHEMLYQNWGGDVMAAVDDNLGTVNLNFDSWFDSFANHSVNPYVSDHPGPV